jgi:hypothetical protein
MKQPAIAASYSAYGLASCGATPAPGLSPLREGESSPAHVTRDLAGPPQTASELRRTVQAWVREGQAAAGVVSRDDSSEEEPYPEEHELGGWPYDHAQARLRQGITFLPALARSQGGRSPFQG